VFDYAVVCWVLQEDLTTRQKQEALYGQTAVHATFGDVELAQITLRGVLVTKRARLLAK
jgi:hypothetical protein